MSLLVLKQGISDSIQDLGRCGFEHLGINPGGAMDVVAAQVANMLAGNEVNEAVIEMHFPASSFLFKEDAIIALSGADFTATLNEEIIPVNATVAVKKYSALQFEKHKSGAWCYLAVHGGFDIPKWLNSYSTHLKAKVGGFEGRCLMKDDELPMRKTDMHLSELHLQGKEHRALSWSADTSFAYHSPSIIRICEGSEFKNLTESSKSFLTSSPFNITNQSDRMGFRMNGESLQMQNPLQLISSAVTRGTIQLFPNGQMIILMADHQTTGGYPGIAHVISADIPKLAQLTPGTSIIFQMIKHTDAEELLVDQTQCLQKLHLSCILRWGEFK